MALFIPTDRPLVDPRSGAIDFGWLALFKTLSEGVTSIPWLNIDFTGSTLASIATRSASDLSSGTVPLARLSGITNTELAAGAAIVRSKLNFGSGLVNADIAAAAGIATSKLDLTADISLGNGAVSITAATQATVQNGSMAFKTIFPSLNADANDYSPTGWADAGATATVIQLTGATANRTITGLAGGVSGRLVCFANRSANSYILADESASSTATNRFRGPAAGAVTIRTDGGVMCVYDGSRWQVMQP